MEDSERTALVTGAGRGIGAAIALALANDGFKVALLARTAIEIEKVAASIREHGGKTLTLIADVTHYEEVKESFHRIEDTWGHLDILVNNAGIGVFSPLETLDIEEFDSVIKTNLYGPFYCTRLALPLMRKNGRGYIFNIGSLAGVNAFKGGTAYCASKAALKMLGECLMLEVRYDGIRVTTLAPGSVDTSFAGQEHGKTWKIPPQQIAQTILNLLHMDENVISSYIEIRPTQPPR